MPYEEALEILKTNDADNYTCGDCHWVNPFLDCGNTSCKYKKAYEVAIEALEKVEQLERENKKLREKMCKCANIVKAYQKYCNEHC